MFRRYLKRTYLSAKQIIKNFEKILEDKNVVAWFENPNHDKLRLNYNLNPDSVVFDLGGYKGYWTSDIFSMYLCTVYVFEPVREFSEYIKERFRGNNRVKAFNFGLGGVTRKEKLYVADLSSSVFGSGDKAEEVQIRDIIAFLEENKIKKIDLMKLNIEGGEYEVLERLLESDFIKNISDIQIQFHNVAPDSEKRMVAIQTALGKTHALTYSYKFFWENWRIK